MIRKPLVKTSLHQNQNSDMAAVKIMGILNVTPDSFSDGGHFNSTSSALAQAEKLIDAGADILDIGGESTRPFATPVSADNELSRVIPAIEAIRKNSSIPISIDTTKAIVAQKALEAGATIINDISALHHDPDMVKLARKTDVPIIIMHMQNNPENMQVDPSYKNVVEEIVSFFKERVSWLEDNGINRNRVTIDPGIGFGKTYEHNLSILKNLQSFSELNLPVLLGHSRKRFLGELTGNEVTDRDFATAIVSALAVPHDIAIMRVHDVASTKTAIDISEAIQNSN